MLKIVHCFDPERNSRYPAMISQGLWFNPDFSVAFNNPFISLGKTLCPAGKDLNALLRDADFIFRSSDEQFQIPAIDTILDVHNLWPKVIYYDCKDSPAIDAHRLKNCAAYIKRSWPIGFDRRPRPMPPAPILPMDFGLLEEFLAVPFPAKKDIAIACLFEKKPAIGKRRAMLVEELEKVAPLYPGSVIGAVTSGERAGRRAIFDEPYSNPFLAYMTILKRAKIVFTAFPDNWDGDSRTWEAFASKALVFMDETFIPSAFPFEHGRHCIIYDARDRQSIREAICLARYYLKNEQARERVALAGYAYALKHHTPVARVKRIMAWVQSSPRHLPDHVINNRQRPFIPEPVHYGFSSPIGEPKPAFLGIGAERAGTTWIFENLRRHPDIFLPDQKALHFFDNGFRQGLAWYFDQFASGSSRVCGEITPSYAILPRLQIEEIAAILPHVKAFFVLRNPIERAWSAACAQVAQVDPAIVTDDLYALHVAHPLTVALSDYRATIENWRTAIGAGQLLILRYEELLTAPDVLLRKLFNFLGVDATIALSAFPLTTRFAAGLAPVPPPWIRQLLLDTYADGIRELAEYLACDLSAWQK
jgi:hypothetical protein